MVIAAQEFAAELEMALAEQALRAAEGRPEVVAGERAPRMLLKARAPSSEL